MKKQQAAVEGVCVSAKDGAEKPLVLDGKNMNAPHTRSSNVSVQSSQDKESKKMVKKALFFQTADVPEKAKDDMSTQTDTDSWAAAVLLLLWLGNRFMKIPRHCLP